MTGPSVPLALLGALLFAVSAALQQHAARRTAAGPVPPRVPRLLRRVAREPLWWLGWVAGLAGFGAQALALRLGSIVVVQALIVTQLLFALPLAAVLTGRRPLRRDWWGAAAVCAGLILLVTVRGGMRPSAGPRPHSVLAIAGAIVVAGGLVAALLVAARLIRPARAATLAVAAGICFCLTAVFLVFAGEEVARHGLPAGVFALPTAGLAVSTATGAVLVQNAFAAGSLSTALTAMTITDPVASWIAGVVVFGGRPSIDAGTLTTSVAAGVLVASGVALLASSPALRERRLSQG